MQGSGTRMINKPIIAVAALVVVLAAAGAYYMRSRAPLPSVATAPVGSVPAEEPAIAHPLPAAAENAASAAALPDLAESDAPLREALGQISSTDAVKNYLLPDNVIRHLVVTIDNLPRPKVAADRRPTVGVTGSFIADGDELHATLDRRNFERYKPMVAVIDKLDMQKLAAVYFHFYPLFQQTYQNLGYPNGYFNDRLVQVIDVLLAAPQVAAPIDLVRPNVMYIFADPALEARPAGQKLLIRMGMENAAVIKAKLSELRAIITAAPPKH
jgi:Protein of unknown function (DUF3014)